MAPYYLVSQSKSPSLSFKTLLSLALVLLSEFQAFFFTHPELHSSENNSDFLAHAAVSYLCVCSHNLLYTSALLCRSISACPDPIHLSRSSSGVTSSRKTFWFLWLDTLFLRPLIALSPCSSPRSVHWVIIKCTGQEIKRLNENLGCGVLCMPLKFSVPRFSSVKLS